MNIFLKLTLLTFIFPSMWINKTLLYHGDYHVDCHGASVTGINLTIYLYF